MIGVFVSDQAGNINNPFIAFADLVAGKFHSQAADVFKNTLAKQTSEHGHQLIGVNSKPFTQFIQRMIM